MEYSLNTWLKVLENMDFEIDEYSKMGSDIGNIRAIKEYDKNSFYIYYRVNIHFNYKTDKITRISIYQGFDKFSDDLNINLELFVKEHINYFREVQLEELFKIIRQEKINNLLNK